MLARDILNASFWLIDLGQTSDDQLEKYFWSGVVSKTLKHIYEKDLLPFLKNSLLKDLQIIEKREEGDYITYIVRYMTIAGEISDTKEFFGILEEGLSEKIREGIMTIAQMLRQEGRQEGWLAGITEGEAKGEVRAIRKMALKLLQLGMSIDQIVQLTELSAQEIEEIKTP